MMQSDAGSAWLEFGAGIVQLLAEAEEPDRAGKGDELRSAFGESLQEQAPFSVIAANARLSSDDAEVLAVLAAAEFDPATSQIVASLQGTRSDRRMTLGTLMLALALFEAHRGVRAVGADAALRTSGLVSVFGDGAWSDHLVAVHGSVVWALVGDESADVDLPRVLARVEGSTNEGSALTAVSGPDRHRRRSAAAEATSGSRFFVVSQPGDAVGWSAIVREATLTGSGVIVEVDGDELVALGRKTIEQATHVSWSISSRTDLPIEQFPDRAWTAIRATADPVTDEEWRAAFGDGVERSHPLAPQQLEPASRAYDALGGDLDGAVRRLASGRLEGLATRIRPSRGWEHLVLSSDKKRTLESIIDRYEHADRVFGEWGYSAQSRLGTVALFTGPSGTGKTLAAEVIAQRLGLDVFKLDLSAIVSKYIGETEKNLEQVFEAASAGNLVLFFDEADALFGKRSEVKDARDRYANIEVSYLLQRIEDYEGLVILATNFEKSLDAAFLRRIHVRVPFESPGADERLQIWTQNVPDGAPRGDLDLDWIADRFEISGGVIRNASVHAAFIAATSEPSEITTEGLVQGVAREYRKMGRIIKRDDFGDHFDLVSDGPTHERPPSPHS